MPLGWISVRVMMTGATGFIGGHTAARAIEAGHEVCALVRSPQKLESLREAFDLPAIDHVVGDMTDPHAVDAALDGADSVIHCAAVVSLDARGNAQGIENSIAGARLVLHRAHELDLDPIIHLSSVAALFDPGAGTLTVDHPPSSAGYTYGQAKADAEMVARKLQADGAPLAIVYPSAVIGPPAGSALGEASEDMARFTATGIIPTRKAAVAISDVRDMASLLVALLEPGHGPRRVMCGGHLVDMSLFAAIYRNLTGRRFPMMPLPPSALRGMGRMADALRRVVPINAAMNRFSMSVLTQWEGSEDSDLAIYGVEFRDIEETFADSLVAWHEAGLLSNRQIGKALPSPDPSKAPTPPKGFRMPARVVLSRPFRMLGPLIVPRVHRAINRLTRGRTLLDSAAQPMLMLFTTGAKTGQTRETPLGAVPLEEGRFLVVGSNFAREQHPAWTANLLANPDAEIIFQGKRTPVRARLLSGPERESRWQTAVGWYPLWTGYDAITQRELRLFELDPVPSAD